MKICNGDCKHKKCIECGHCKSYHRLQITQYYTAPAPCQQINRYSLKACNCKDFKEPK